MINVSRMAVATVLVILLGTIPVSAEWRIEIDSIEVDPDTVTAGVSLDFTAFWDLALTALSVPFVVREIEPGAFWTGDLPYDTGGNAFVKPHIQGVEWKWFSPWAVIVEEVRPATGIIAVPELACDPVADTLYDGISPDHFVINVQSSGLSTPAESDGRVFLTLIFDVTDAGGRFEFDTACFAVQLFTIFMIDNQFPPVDHGHGNMGTGEATFGRGVVTIVGCNCTDFCEMDGEAELTPVDVAYIVNYVYKGLDARPVLPNCPGDNGDWDCSGTVDSLDVTWYVQYVYKTSGVGPCDPCDCAPYPEGCPKFP
ncbi:hypothetical protein ACFLQW_04510 [Candidatus Zixiibacteriota bacterium]